MRNQVILKLSLKTELSVKRIKIPNTLVQDEFIYERDFLC